MPTSSALDRLGRHPGYWPSAWPVECGGNRRQKSSPGRLDAGSGDAEVVTRRNGRWNVMVVERDPGQWFLAGTMPAFSGDPPFGWVQRIDADTLEPTAQSTELPCGEHVWCGAVLAHANGSIMSVNGAYLHRLDPDDLSIIAERRLPVDRSHNGRRGARVVKELGDGLMVWVPDPVAAVEAALELLLAVDASRRAGRFPLAVRAGLHHGEVVVRDDDLVGRTVNVASRLVDLAGPGELLASEDAVAAGRAGDGRFEPVGPVVVKGVGRPIWLHRAVR